MSREKIGLKQSSTLSAKAAYALLLKNDYRPQLLDEKKSLLPLSWEQAIRDSNVVHSQSGKSIHMIDTSGRNRPMIDLKVKGMMSESSLSFFKDHASVTMKPLP
jgi:hypothetical protein